MKRMWKKRIACFLWVLVMVLNVTACQDSERGKVVFTTSLGKEELFRIGEVSCTLPEYMLYLTNMQNKYEAVYGEEIWNVTYGGVVFEDNMKDIVLAKLAQMKSVYLLAQTKGVTLTESEEQILKEAASKYYTSLSATEKEALNVTEEIVLQLYRENALADKVYQQIVSLVNPEISDDEARTVTVEQIYIQTYTTNSMGERIDFTTGMKAELASKLEGIREKAINGEEGFTELAGKYSEKENIRISFKKGEVDMAIENVAFNLQTDEVSEMIETSDGYYLLKCITTFDREETDANKLVLVEQRRNEAFGKEYEEFVRTLARKLNEKLWQEVDLIHTDGVDTDEFFEIYEESLQKF